MAGLSDLFNIGRPVFEVGGTGSQPSAGGYPPLDKNVLLILADKNHITAKAMVSLGKEYTFDDAVTLYDSDDIVDEDTFVLVTGKLPPVQKLSVMYGDWHDMPALPALGNPGQMTWDEIVLPASETFSIASDYRASVHVEWRPKLLNDSDTYPTGPHGEREFYAQIPPDLITVTALSNRKRNYSAQARVVRRYAAATAGYAPGELEYRYYLNLSRRQGA
jgi:hypothetical protein